MLILTLLGCAPQMFHVPGPLASMGQEPAPAWGEHASRPARTSPALPAEGAAPAAIAAAAAGFVGERALVVDGERYRMDCSGLVEASLASAGCAFHGSSASLFEQARADGVLHRRHRPSPGDVAFFDDTYDRNHNGRRDDPLSHVAVVESVERDGTIHLVHYGSHGPGTLTMNLRHPDEHVDADGKLLNDYLRVASPRDSPRTRYLAGELWVAFGSFWDAAPPAVDPGTSQAAR